MKRIERIIPEAKRRICLTNETLAYPIVERGSQRLPRIRDEHHEDNPLLIAMHRKGV